MKLITYEVSDRSLAVTTLKESGAMWDCSIILSRVDPISGNETYGLERTCFNSTSDADDLLEQASELTNAFIDNFFPEFAEAA